MRKTISPGARRSSGYAEANIPDASENASYKGASEFSRVLLKCIPGMQGVMRVASSDRFKKTEHYAFKIGLQDAYFHVLIHPSRRKYLRFAFEKAKYINSE